MWLDHPSRLFQTSILHRSNNRATSSAVTYGGGRLRYWPRDSAPSSEKSLLPVEALVAGNSTSSASTSLDVKFPCEKVIVSSLGRG